MIGLCVSCGGGGGSDILPIDPEAFENDFSNARVFMTDSSYANVIVGCVVAETVAESCTLNDFPLVGMEHSEPAIADIMERVVVSHDWMATRFEQVLNVLPDDILFLLGGVTAVVIDDDIRPSHFATLTAAIYLDPALLWLTNAEKSTINQKKDFRSGFGHSLGFRPLGRYIRNNAYAYHSYPLDGDEERSLSDITLAFAAMLYHELAHANDFFRSDVVATLDLNETVISAASSLSDFRTANSLANQYPLVDEVMYGLANVMYRGETPTLEQRQLSASKVGELFESDSASDDYAYASIYEDVAMLFEETMMKFHFNVDRDIAFTNTPADETDCGQYFVSWGSRNRIGDVDVKARAQYVVENLLPGNDMQSFFENLTLPIAMQIGVTWCDNLHLPSASDGGSTIARTAPGDSDSSAFSVEDLLRNY